jgi:hypothetical protein
MIGSAQIQPFQSTAATGIEGSRSKLVRVYGLHRRPRKTYGILRYDLSWRSIHSTKIMCGKVRAEMNTK